MTKEFDNYFQVAGRQTGRDWRLFKAVAKNESSFNPEAVSHCGAVGLMQLMPATAKDLGLCRTDLLKNPVVNITLGSEYLTEQIEHLPEIPDQNERLKCALAAYNGGRGYINKAIRIHRSQAKQPPTWDDISKILGDVTCQVRGKRPDHRQIITYVDKVWKSYQAYKKEETAA